MIDLDAPDDYKTKDRDFRFFVKECKRFQKELGLLAWQIYYEHAKNRENCLAWATAKEATASATICLNVNWQTLQPTEFELSRSAFHEMCELLTWKLDEMARVGCSGDRCNTERHVIIMTLENTLFPFLVKKQGKRGKKK
jgi:hypothetical protein